MKIASLFKKFVATYNRTYESKEGKDSAVAVFVLVRLGSYPNEFGRGRTQEAVHPFKDASAPKFFSSPPGLVSHPKYLSASVLSS